MSEVIPKELTLENVQNLSSVIESSEHQSIINSNGSSFTVGSGSSGVYVNFNLPSGSNLNIDLASLWITGDLQIPSFTPAANTYVTLANNIESMIDMVQILFGGEIIEEIRNYYLIESALLPYNVNNNYVNAVQPASLEGNWLMKHTLLCSGSAPLANSPKIFNKLNFGFPLRLSGFMNSNKLLPTYLSQSSNFQIRIYLKNVEEVVKTFTLSLAVGTSGDASKGAATPISSYVVSNFKMHYKACRVSNNYMGQIMSYASSNEITVPIRTWYSEIKNLTIPASSSSFSWSESITANFSSTDAVYVAFFQNLNDQAEFGSDRVRFPGYKAADPNTGAGVGGLQTARLLINGRSIPSGQPISYENGGAEGLIHLLKALNSNRLGDVIGNYGMDTINIMPTNGSGIGDWRVPKGYYYAREMDATNVPLLTGNTAPNKWSGALADRISYFVMGFDLRRSDYADDAILSGLDMSQSTGQITLQCQFNNSTTSVSYTVLFMVAHTRVLSLSTENIKVIS